MKKFTRVVSLVVLSSTLVVLAGCSSTPKETTDATTEVPVEANAGGEAFNSLANSDLTPTADPGAVVDTATPSSVMAAASAPSYTAQSPVNLGASSAGRSH